MTTPNAEDAARALNMPDCRSPKRCAIYTDTLVGRFHGDAGAAPRGRGIVRVGDVE